MLRAQPIRQDRRTYARCGRSRDMGRPLTTALYVLAMIVVIVGVDILFFRERFWPRLIVNVGIVLVFGAFYLRYFRHP
jgi:hypothetical protein